MAQQGDSAGERTSLPLFQMGKVVYNGLAGRLPSWMRETAEDARLRGGYRGETAGPLWPVDDKGGRDHDKDPDWRPLAQHPLGGQARLRRQRPGLALQRQPRHRPQPRKGRGAHLQQRRGALWGRLCRGSARRAGQRHPAHLHGLFPRRHPLEDRRKQDPLCGRGGQALHAGLRLRSAPGQGRGHLLHHVVHGLLRRGHRPGAHEGLQDLCPHGESLHSL